MAMRTTIKPLLGVLLALCAGMSLAQTKLRAWNIHPDGYPTTEAMKSFAEQLGALYGRYMADPTTREELLTIISK